MEGDESIPIIQGVVVEGLEASSLILPPGVVMEREDYDMRLSLLHQPANDDEIRDYEAVRKIRYKDEALYRASQQRSVAPFPGTITIPSGGMIHFSHMHYNFIY